MMQDDKKLQKLIQDLAYYCKEKNYAVVISAGTEDENVIAYNGELWKLARQLCAFAEQLENKGCKNFFKLATELFVETAKEMDKFKKANIKKRGKIYIKEDDKHYIN